ncbi:lipoprotein releasing system transmembrane protein lolC [Formosa agariphila KMM 3901]|uniref:Lipoprotein releasing system transmembrane protein lolC n=1 Tax=Formosa agariphila (strain DSM 15362 / KCTC 12365 / LMG 23005 / KMM 3901 / M-2Alg 35-1) TaxID=1347342 RepID=T2KH40_FORAG|nr:FtsX-like permease family protein [Formosa agariphila]CDF77713.1 lipoprotein releasing system transmembrane protein lolC [Formosa agariphila KMM 3901]
MNFPLYIAKRYLRSKSSNNAINFITIIAAIGVILGAASLFIVLSGFSGLKVFTLQFSSIIDPDLKAVPKSGKSFMLSSSQFKAMNNLDGVASYSKIIEERVILAYDGKNFPAFIKGVDENYNQVNAIDSVIIQGSWLRPNTDQMVAGWGVSNHLSLGVLDYGKSVTIYVPKPGTGQITSTKSAFNAIHCVNVGLFDINESLNETYIYTAFEKSRELLSYKQNQVSALEFKLNPNIDEDLIKPQLQAILGESVLIKNRVQLNDALYKMLNTENLAVYLIFTLVLIIALFNVIGSIVMMILDKKKTLSTLYKLGASVKDIRRIFFFQGSLMSIFGGIVGLILGLIIVGLQQAFSLVMITPSLPYPVAITIPNIIVVLLTISVLGIIASKIASVRISKSLIKTI